MDIQKVINKIKKSWIDLDKTDKFVIIFLIFSFIVRLITVYPSPFRGWDETVYLNLGLDLSRHPLSYSLLNTGWNDYIPSTDAIYGWPNIGFRAPLLPYLLSIFYFLKLDYFIPAVIPFITTVSVYLIYKLGKMLFNKKVGLYSLVLFSLVPIHLYCSGKIWTDAFVVFFLLLTFISFWKGYENGSKKHKVLFGLFLALSLLARYTTLWITPVFLVYFAIRDKSFKFLADKYLWSAIGVFFLTLIPWFIYGYIYYNNPLGGFIHGFKAAGYWGGVQSWTYFIENSWRIFSIVGVFSILSLIYLFIKKEFIRKEVYLLFIWLVLFSVIVMAMPHKEDRFIMPVIPVICLISGLFISKLGKFKHYILGILCIVLVIAFYNSYKIEMANSKDLSIACYSDGNKFIKNNISKENSLIVNNQDPMTHYYTGKNILVYPDPWNLDVFRNTINSKFENKKVYMFFSNYDMVMDSKVKNDLDNNFNKLFECKKGYGYSAVYEYK